jgi:mannose-6-phosphate isomerase-like protein (cupin superfamily)
MIVQQIGNQSPFTTRDGSSIRSILDRANAPVEKQSLAEATMAPGQSTERHHHKLCEELYFLLEGTALMEIDGETRDVTTGDAILIPPGARHQITAKTKLRFLCCCAPPYDHADTFLD